MRHHGAGCFVLNVPRLVGSSFRTCLLAFEVGGGWGEIGRCTHPLLSLTSYACWHGPGPIACALRAVAVCFGHRPECPAPSISLRLCARGWARPVCMPTHCPGATELLAPTMQLSRGKAARRASACPLVGGGGRWPPRTATAAVCGRRLAHDPWNICWGLVHARVFVVGQASGGDRP